MAVLVSGLPAATPRPGTLLSRDTTQPSLSLPSWFDEIWIGLPVLALLVTLPTRWRNYGLLLAGLSALLLTIDLAGEAAFSEPGPGDSFPSGHAVRTMAWAVSLILVSWPTTWRRKVLLAAPRSCFLSVPHASTSASTTRRTSSAAGQSPSLPSPACHWCAQLIHWERHGRGRTRCGRFGACRRAQRRSANGSPTG